MRESTCLLKRFLLMTLQCRKLFWRSWHIEMAKVTSLNAKHKNIFTDERWTESKIQKKDLEKTFQRPLIFICQGLLDRLPSHYQKVSSGSPIADDEYFIAKSNQSQPFVRVYDGKISIYNLILSEHNHFCHKLYSCEPATATFIDYALTY